MKFRPDIEGLRAIAIVPVVLYHASSSLVPGGFIGVDVFFVISGFLISKIILDDLDNGSFSYVHFYRRRIRRIFPALFFMLAAASAMAFIILPPAALREFGQTLAATVLFVSNMEFYRLSDYFAGSSEFKPLLHTWSLAVEEQFYIFFPFVLFATRRWLGRKYFLPVILFCTGLSLLISAWLLMRDPPAAFFYGPPRAFELMIGVVLALGALPQIDRPAVREITAAAGLAFILVSAFAFSQNTLFPGPAALLPCLGAAAVIYAGQSGNSVAARLLAQPAVRFIGAISYSLYLWHWPLLSLTRNYFLGQVPPAAMACAVLVSLAMAIFSGRYIEQPFRSPANRDRPIFAKAAMAMAAAMAVSLVVIAGHGLPGRFPAASQRLFAYDNDVEHRRAQCHDRFHAAFSYGQNCRFGDPEEPADVAVWGDSHGAELSVALGESVGRSHSVMQITASACPPALNFDTGLRGECAAHNRETIAHLTRDAHIRTVVLVARYGEYLEPHEWPKFRSGFEKAASELVGAGKKVAVVYPVPSFPSFSYPVPDALGILVARGVAPESYGLARASYEKSNAPAIQELNALTGKLHLDRVVPEDIFCNANLCPTYDGRHPLYFDENHLTVTGARKLAVAIKALL